MASLICSDNDQRVSGQTRPENTKMASKRNSLSENWHSGKMASHNLITMEGWLILVLQDEGFCDLSTATQRQLVNLGIKLLNMYLQCIQHGSPSAEFAACLRNGSLCEWVSRLVGTLSRVVAWVRERMYSYLGDYHNDSHQQQTF